MEPDYPEVEVLKRTTLVLDSESVPGTPSHVAVNTFPKEAEMQSVRKLVPALTALLLATGMLAFGTGSARAQEASPTAAMDSPHPVHIHSGACDSLGDVVFPLSDITTYEVTRAFSFGPAATPEPASMATPLAGVAVTQVVPVEFSFTHIDANVVDLVTGGFAINAHESAENIQNYIACGNIPPCTAAVCAAVTGVAVELAPQNNSGYFGVARIDADPNGGSNVSIFLFHLNLPASS